MKILYIVHQFMPEYSAGTETVTFRLAKAAQRSGHSVTVLTCSTREAADWQGLTKDGLRWTSINGVPVFAIPGNLVSDPYGFNPEADAQAEDILRQFVARQNFDICHIMHLLRMASAARIIRELRIPYIITLTDFFALCYRVNHVLPSGDLCHGSLHGHHCDLNCAIPGKRLSDRHGLFGRLLAEATERITCSNFVRDIFVREYPNLTFRVIPHGTDLLRFHRKTYSENSNGVTFGYLGTLSKAKGVDILVSAFIEANVAEAKLVIVGPADENSELVTNIRRISKADRRVTLKAPVSADEVPDILTGFDVLCIPSQVPESFSLVLHEGLATGLPAIVSDLGNLAEVVENSGCGRVVKAADPKAWADAIKDTVRQRSQLQAWQAIIPSLSRVEEEAFFYEKLYSAGITQIAMT